MTPNRPKLKTIVMLASLALVLGAGTACFGLSSRGSGSSAPAVQESCENLTGQARIDCENRKKP